MSVQLADEGEIEVLRKLIGPPLVEHNWSMYCVPRREVGGGGNGQGHAVVLCNIKERSNNLLLLNNPEGWVADDKAEERTRTAGTGKK